MLSIGEFAKQGGVSARMLRHYDALGLLRPAHVGENGYRLYDEMQLPVLAQIETLKGYGFALAEIGGLLTLPRETLAQRIHIRRLAAFRELGELRRRIRRMEEDVIRMEGTGMQNEKYHVIIMELPEQRVFGIRRTIRVDETHALFEELHREMEARGLRRVGATQQAYHGYEFSYESMDVEAQAAVAPETEGEGVSTIPAGTFAAVTHVGPYEELRYAYDAISTWIGAHQEYEVCGPALERYLKDEASVDSPEELETGVLFPVRLRK